MSLTRLRHDLEALGRIGVPERSIERVWAIVSAEYESTKGHPAEPLRPFLVSSAGITGRSPSHLLPPCPATGGGGREV